MTNEEPTTPDLGVGRKPSKPTLGSMLRIPLRCGGKNGRCGAPVLVSLEAFAGPANLRRVLAQAGWGLITHGMVHEGQPIPLIDPACPVCHEEYTEQQAELAAKKAAADAAAATLAANEEEAGANDNGVDGAIVPDGVVNAATGIEEPEGLPEGAPASGK